MRLFFDGLCELKNPGGVACYGFVVYEGSSSEGPKLFESYGVAAEPGPDSTNNVGEYTGLIKGLEWIRKNTDDPNVELLGDSQIVIYHLTGEYKVRSSGLMPLYQKTLSDSWSISAGPPNGYLVKQTLSLMLYRRKRTPSTG